MDSPGRSGAKFFISFDKRFVIKSITGEEVALLHQILQAYHAVSTSIFTCAMHPPVKAYSEETPITFWYSNTTAPTLIYMYTHLYVSSW